VGEEDDLADPTDVNWLKTQLGTRVKETVIIPRFDHYSFSIGSNHDWLPKVVDIVSKLKEEDVHSFIY